jgi:hypothetical protein
MPLQKARRRGQKVSLDLPLQMGAISIYLIISLQNKLK